jgi:signal transduction histidine kinase
MGGDLEDLVMGMSTELLGAGCDGIGATIAASLERLCGALDADRGYVLKASVAGRSGGEAFEEWWAPGVDQRNTPIAALPRDAQRFWMRSLRAGEVVRATDVEELERSCREAAAALRDDGVRSILFVPLVARSEPVGFVGFEARRGNVAWDDRTVARLRTVGELLVGALERCQADAERAAAAADLASRNVELERSNRELQHFASVVSHDLNQPLVMVRGFLDALTAVAREHPTRADEAMQYAEAAQRSTARMRALINDVLAIARAGGPVARPAGVPLGSLVAEVVTDLAAAIDEADAEVVIGELPTIEGGSTQLRQLFQNLLANAVKYRHPERRPVVELSAAARNGSWVISVSDNGVGIPADQRAAVFEMFARADDGAAAGLGIGLAVCARVVAAHGGRIWIEGSPTGGTTVQVSLPARQPSPAS